MFVYCGLGVYSDIEKNFEESFAAVHVSILFSDIFEAYYGYLEVLLLALFFPGDILLFNTLHLVHDAFLYKDLFLIWVR